MNTNDFPKTTNIFITSQYVCGINLKYFLLYMELLYSMVARRHLNFRKGKERSIIGLNNKKVIKFCIPWSAKMTLYDFNLGPTSDTHDVDFGYCL